MWNTVRGYNLKIKENKKKKIRKSAKTLLIIVSGKFRFQRLTTNVILEKYYFNKCFIVNLFHQNRTHLTWFDSKLHFYEYLFMNQRLFNSNDVVWRLFALKANKSICMSAYAYALFFKKKYTLFTSYQSHPIWILSTIAMNSQDLQLNVSLSIGLHFNHIIWPVQ